MELEKTVVKGIAEAKASSAETADNPNTDKVTVKQKVSIKKPSTKQLLELEQDFIVPVDPSTAPQRFKGAALLFKCELCRRHFESVSGAKGHTHEKKHKEKKNLKKVEEGLKLVGIPSKEQFDAITVKVEQVYQEWSAEACGQIPVREKIVSDFDQFLKTIDGCDNIGVEFFGSSYSQFALKDSDINMNLIFKGTSIKRASNYFKVMRSISKRLVELAAKSSDDAVYCDYEDYLYSPVSHITFVHKPTGLKCHVRFGCHHEVAVRTSQLLRLYGEVDHRVKVLGVVFKYWAKLCQLDDQILGSYPSQMFVLMVVHYLQQLAPPILPIPPKPDNFGEVTQCLEHAEGYLTELGHMIKSWKVTNTDSIGMLWFGLFRFYCDEDVIGTTVVQVATLEPLLKHDRNWSVHKLVVCSPFNPSYNIGKGSASQNMYLYMKICLKATMVYFGRNSSNNQKTSTISNEKTAVPERAAQSTAVKKTTPKLNKSHTSNNKSDVPNNSSPTHQVAADEVQESDNKTEQLLSNGLIKSEESDTNDDDMLPQSTESCDTDGGSHDTSCDHTDGNTMIVEDVESTITQCDDLQYDFVASHFIIKKLPEVCSACKQEGHIYTSLVGSMNCTLCLNCLPKECYDKEEEVKLEQFPPLSARHFNQLEALFTNLKERIGLKTMDKCKRREICSILQQYIRSVYSDAELMLFGSSANEFGTPSSDIDISMKLPGQSEFLDHDKKSEIISMVAKELRSRKQSHWWANSVVSIVTARVPIVKVKLMQRWDELECDISMGNYLALHNTKLLASYASIDHRVSILGHVLKEFAKSCDICDASAGSLSSYAHILLLLHYLQQVKPPVIPVLQQVGKPDVIDVDGWNCWFYKFDHLFQLTKVWPHVGENKSSVGELWVNFFKYYLEQFDWKRDVVTVRQLEQLSKLEKEWASKRACIEDPFNLDHNLSNHLSVKMWGYIRHVFKYAHDHFANPSLYDQQLTIQKALSIGFTMDVPQDGLCHSCGKRGHLSRNCPNSENMRRPYITCFRCGKLGHVKSKCPELESEEQGESPDSAAIQSAIIKKKKKNKSVARDIEIKPPGSRNNLLSESSPPGSVPSRTHEISTSPIRQSSPLSPQLANTTPPSVMTQHHLPPYPQPSPSVPYTASRRPPLMVSSPAANKVNRHYTPPNQALLTTPPPQRPHGHIYTPPNQKQYRHQPYHMGYGSPMPPRYIPNPAVVPVVPEGSYYMQQPQEYLFPPPTMQPPQQYEVPVPRSKHNSDFINEQIDDITVYNPAPPTTRTTAPTKTTAAEDIASIDWNELANDTTSKNRREKTKHRAAKSSTQSSSNNFSTSPPSVGESSQGKPVIKGVSTRKVGRGRARSSRETSTTHASSKQKHQQR